jgi:hydroxymethylpyrimidine/phosphomethylpyrimidine kinase
MRTALTIAGSDSGSGAGIQADLKTFAAHGVYGTSVITAVTAQNTRGVAAFEAVATDLVIAQMEAVMSDIGAHAAKTGMLPTAAIVEAVGAAVDALEIPLLVVDPVMVAKSGDRLLDDEAIAAIQSELLPRAFVVTPNIPEAEVLSRMAIRTDDDCREAARRIAAFGPATVLIKGGHRADAAIRDLLHVPHRRGGPGDGDEFIEFTAERVPGSHTHGTGCTFAAALASHLALGRQLAEAVPLAQRYVAGAIRHAPGLGHGHGPMDHFWERPPCRSSPSLPSRWT